MLTTIVMYGKMSTALLGLLRVFVVISAISHFYSVFLHPFKVVPPNKECLLVRFGEFHLARFRTLPAGFLLFWPDRNRLGSDPSLSGFSFLFRSKYALPEDSL